jgi:hypothetical protein
MLPTRCTSGLEYHTFEGYIDSVQVRTGEKYAGTFTPSELAVDASTVALWRAADGTTTAIPDASGNGNTMSLVGTAEIVTLTECPY